MRSRRISRDVGERGIGERHGPDSAAAPQPDRLPELGAEKAIQRGCHERHELKVSGSFSRSPPGLDG